MKLAIAGLAAERIDPLDRSWVIVMSKKGGVDLDSILDQALDDFDEIETADIKRKALLKAERQISKKNELLAAQKLISSKDTQKSSSKVVIMTFMRIWRIDSFVRLPADFLRTRFALTSYW